MIWIPFISQTGSEIYNIHMSTGIKPLFVVTNNMDGIRQEVRDSFDFKVIPNRPILDDYMSLNIPINATITLNGWLRIVPEEFVNKYDIYNGHPGLINKYPELKGKDPQYRAYIGKYKEIGGVIHRVTKDVDEGEILYHKSVEICDITLDEYYSILAQNQLNMWIEFFKDRSK